MAEVCQIRERRRSSANSPAWSDDQGNTDEHGFNELLPGCGVPALLSWSAIRGNILVAASVSIKQAKRSHEANAFGTDIVRQGLA